MMRKNFLTQTLVTILAIAVNFTFAQLIQEVEFDTTEVNSTIEQVITLSNTGDLPLAIYKIALISETDSYELIADSSYSIEGGEQIDIQINFTPKNGGNQTATLYIESNDEENSEVTLTLNGFGKETSTTAMDEFNGLPTEFKLNQNFPNPFNPSTTVKYELPENSKIILAIYNLQGQKVTTLANDFQTAGYHQVIWNGTNDMGQKVSSGVYFLRMQTENFVKTISMTFTK